MKTGQIAARIALVIIVLAAFFTIAATPWIMNKTSPEMGIYTGATSGFLLLIFLLDLKAMRFPKGMLLIAYGVIFQVLFTKYYYLFIDHTSPATDDLKVQLDLYMQVLLFACAGAGGSIIANYADKSSSDYEQSQSNSTIIDNTKNIDMLRNSTKEIERKVNIVVIMSTISILATTLTFVALVFK
ncbi:hypothetical protein [Pseudomonas azotoformans]|uniref:hypothetical protein n=1 Tax=Pseudomonas azotoformans TaxID=47878 RepID=UPI001146B3E3|nr:hypothetical protein [Pseudomonas azotoformans]QDH64154.1 hypothetical protein FKZ69_09080 [Pseudomonas azotoformans]